MRLAHATLMMLCLLLLAACGPSGDAAAPGASGPAAVATLPATVEGQLMVDVAEGDVDEAGISDFNFGTLTVDGEELLVEIPGELLRGAGLPAEGGPVRITLVERHETYGHPMYRVGALQRR